MKDIKNMSTEELEQEIKTIRFLRTALDSHREKLTTQHEKELADIKKHDDKLFHIRVEMSREIKNRTVDEKLNKNKSPMDEVMEEYCDRVVLDKNFFKSE